MKLMEKEAFTLTPDQLAAFAHEGYLIIRQLFTVEEVAACRQRFDEWSAAGQPIPDYWVPELDTTDPLQRYPRVMQPHRFDALSKRMLLDRRVHEVLAALMGEEPIACQSMFYFKPPSSRGQALHQDNFYLQVKPQTCIAAWTAIDPARPENGGLYVVPGTQNMDIVCPETADAGESFTTHLVRAPAGLKAMPAVLEPGDVLFFNGRVIHGSGPNRHATLWRRSFICHYMPQSSTNVSKYYRPLLDFNGREIAYGFADDGGPCGKEFDPGQYGSYGKWH